MSSGFRGKRRLKRRTLITALVLATATPILSGCAELMLLHNVAILVAAVSAKPSTEDHWTETNRQIYAYPVPVVYQLLTQEVERNDRKMTSRDESSHQLLVSYPFSLLKNNWGGSLKITCAPTDFGTEVIISSDGRDAVARVRLIGDEVLGDLVSALRQHERSL